MNPATPPAWSGQRPTPRGARILDLSVALSLAFLAVLFALGWWAGDWCLDAGGRVVRGPVDQFCEFADGRREPLSLHFTRAGWLAAGASWLALAVTLFWAGRRFIRRGIGERG